jgi:release factor glutamine methyltransferase
VASAIRFLQADLLTALKPGPRFVLMAANPPYVPRRVWERLPRDIRGFEPRAAFLAGEEGLDVLRPLIRQAQDYLLPGGWLALEVGDGQAEAVRQLLEDTAAYDQVDLLRDYQGVQRVVRGRRA